MLVQQTIEDQQKQLEKLLKECALVRQPPITIAEISWTALRNMAGYSIGMTIKGKENLSPHRFSLSGFDLEQTGPYLRDILNGWCHQIEKKISV